MSLKITNFKLQSHLPGTNEINSVQCNMALLPFWPAHLVPGLISYQPRRSHNNTRETKQLLLSSYSVYVYLFSSDQIILKFCTEHGSITAMLCAKIQNNLTTEMDIIDEWVFVKFEFKTVLQPSYFYNGESLNLKSLYIETRPIVFYRESPYS